VQILSIFLLLPVYPPPVGENIFLPFPADIDCTFFSEFFSDLLLLFLVVVDVSKGNYKDPQFSVKGRPFLIDRCFQLGKTSVFFLVVPPQPYSPPSPALPSFG